MIFNVRKISGFTLIELMFTISIAAILLVVGLPNLSDVIRNNQMASTYNGFMGDLAFVRAESLRTNSPVVMCPTINLTSCAGTDWDGGWLAFVDDGAGVAANAMNRAVDAGEVILRVGQPAPDGIEIRTDGFPSANNILFSGNGKIEFGEIDDIGVFILCNAGGDADALGVAFSVFGQRRRLQDTNDSGVLDYELFAGGVATLTEVDCTP